MRKKISLFFFLCALMFLSASSFASSATPASHSSIIQKHFNKASKSIVKIRTTFISTGKVLQRTATFTGAGVIVHPDGVIFTNAHLLVEDGFELEEITVILWDGTLYKSKKIWIDTEKDMARIHIEAIFPHYTKVDPRDFDRIEQADAAGEEVFIIGHPFGELTWAVALGIISHPSRKLVDFSQTFIEVNMDINPGNSGGGLFDGEGELIGIPTATIRGSGFGFAIPIKRFCDADREHGYDACSQSVPEKEITHPPTQLFPYSPSH